MHGRQLLSENKSSQFQKIKPVPFSPRDGINNRQEKSLSTPFLHHHPIDSLNSFLYKHV